MEVGVEVWIKDTLGAESWIAGFVHSKTVLPDGKLSVVVKNEIGDDFKFSFTDESQEIDDLKLRNDASESELENLINLPHLHEPAILYCLQQRYTKSDIYTYTGPILIAMNPFKKVPLYTNQILEVYYNSGLLKAQGIESGTTLSPHVYAIADAAYREMMKVIMAGFERGSGKSGAASSGSMQSANHSILISGESGAGKTESTKIVLRYLTTVGNSTGGLDTETGSVMDKVLQSNPILEAFGNARTLRNDNSSRFGKFIELNFNKRGHLIGSKIKTYLLEKVRLPSQQRGERNFHVFYQITAGATEAERERWKLKSVEEHIYTAQGGIFKLRDFDDVDGFQDLRQGLITLNFKEEDRTSLFDLVAGLLHLGEVEFNSTFDGEGEGSELNQSESCLTSLEMVSTLCGLDSADVIRTLTVRSIVTRDETFEKKLTPVQSSDARDALAKAIYGRVFDWIVYTINLSIQVDPKLVRANIGVLDIFGFECFTNNSFEQLCINYTNETLQQQFNQYIFKMEQIEYSNEKIEWSFIEFPDNQDCLDLIEHKLNGILAMIDDECRLPKASDEKLASRMYKALETHQRFSASAPQKRDHKFCIKHYAGNVIYSTITFVEKNKDELPKEASTLLQNSSVPLLSHLFTVFGPTGASTQDKLSYATPTTPTGGEAQSRRPADKSAPSKPVNKAAAITSLNSVAAQFKGQLQDLMDSIRSTTPHYIRCLKPNDENVSDNFNRIRITEQLRYGGVLEAVRVARSGFPVRLTHVDFYSRYRSLANPFLEVTHTLPAFLSDKKKHNLKELCDTLLHALWDESIPSDDKHTRKLTRRQSKIDDINQWKGKSEIAKESIQMGLTKVFLRKPAHDVLESRRSRRMISAARRIQCSFRRHRIHAWYRRVLWSVALFQRVGRGMIARARANFNRKLRASLRIQRNVRSFLCRSRYLHYYSAIVSLQLRFRGKKASKFVGVARDNLRACRLQKFVRGLIARYHFKSFRKAVVVLQSRLRKYQARGVLKALRVAAKDVGKLKQSNDALKQEIEALKAKAAEDSKRVREEMERQMVVKASEAKVQEFSNLQQELENALRLLKIEQGLRQTAEVALTQAEEKLLAAEKQLIASSHLLTKSEEEISVLQYKLNQKEQDLIVERSRIAPVTPHSSATTPHSTAAGAAPPRASSMGSPTASEGSRKHSVLMPPSINIPGGVVRSPTTSAENRKSLSRGSRGPSPVTLPSDKPMSPVSFGPGGKPSSPILAGVAHQSSPSISGLPEPPKDQHTAAPVYATAAGGASSLPPPHPAAHGPSHPTGHPSVAHAIFDHIESVGSPISTSSSSGGQVMYSADGQHHQHHANFAQQNNLTGLAMMNEEMLRYVNQSDEKYREAIDALEKEAYARQVLEEEVSRLRHLSMEYKSQIDSLRRTSVLMPPVQHSSDGSSSIGPNRRQSTVATSAAHAAAHSANLNVSADSRRRASQPSLNQAAAAALASNPKLAESSHFGKNWDEDESSSEKSIVSPRSSISDGTAAVQAAQDKIQAQAEASAVQMYEKNITETRARLKMGVKALFWEGQKVSNAEILLKLDPSGRLIVFESTAKKSAFALFQSRVDIIPLGLSDIAEFIAGADVKGDGSMEEALCFTIVAKASQYEGARIIALKFVSRDVRNTTLTNLRKLVSDLQVNLSSKVASTAAPVVKSATASIGGGSVNPMAKQAQSMPHHRGSVTGANGEVTGSNPMMAHRTSTSNSAAAAPTPARRMSMRELAQEEKQKNAEVVANFRRPSSLADSVVTSEEHTKMIHNFKKQLVEEKEKHDKITIQMLILTNDLQERDEQIVALKKKEEQFEQILIDRDNMFKQDAMVRMQLGKRLEQVLMDKEEALEQLELMTDKMESIKASFEAIQRVN